MHSLLCKECVLQSVAILALLSLSFPGTLSPTTSSSVFVCLCLSVFRCLFLPCLSVSFSLCLFFLYSLFPSHFFLSISFSMALFLCLSFCVSLCVYLCEYLCLSVCLCLFLSLCLLLCLSLYIYPSVCLRNRYQNMSRVDMIFPLCKGENQDGVYFILCFPAFCLDSNSFH